MDIAEHSMCQPGKPGPHGLGQTICRFSPADFQRVKSSGLCLWGSTSPRVPARSFAVVFRESRP